MLTGFNPFTNMPSFYGRGWNVSYDQQGRLRLNPSGAFDLGVATFVNLVPAEQLGIVVLTNGRPVGIPEALGTIFSDIALYGKPTQDWFSLYKQRFSDPATTGTAAGFDYSKPPAPPAPAPQPTVYLGNNANDSFAELAMFGKQCGIAIAG